jgi:hypothetical protein
MTGRSMKLYVDAQGLSGGLGLLGDPQYITWVCRVEHVGVYMTLFDF